MRTNAVRLRATRPDSRLEATAQDLVDDLLEWLARAMDLLLDHLGDVGVQRQRGTHGDIMMLAQERVKMSQDGDWATFDAVMPSIAVRISSELRTLRSCARRGDSGSHPSFT